MFEFLIIMKIKEKYASSSIKIYEMNKTDTDSK